MSTIRMRMAFPALVVIAGFSSAARITDVHPIGGLAPRDR